MRRHVLTSVTLLASLTACATGGMHRAHSYAVPDTIHTVYVDTFGNSPFARDMRETVIARLGNTGRFTVVANADSADALIGGSIVVVEQNPSLRVNTPSGSAGMVERATGRVLWQHVYRDESTGAEMAKPTESRQVFLMARQFVEQLLGATAPVAPVQPVEQP